jgi:membrane protease subunit (stomatin/prohibitin family)
MGFMDKLRGELIDIVEWVDDSRHTLVWRFPRYHNQIKYGAQLIVRPGQSAIFVREGRIADVFGPGQYRLETKNLPILSTLEGWKYGFDSPFKAEVYFVSTRQIPDLKWGTPNPVMMRDADFGPIRLRAFGTYTLKASEPRALLQELVGADSSFEADEISELLRSIINHSFAELVASAEIAALDLAENYRELSEQLRLRVVEKIDDEYGLDLPQLYIVNISLPPEVEKALDARTGMALVGDLAQYQQYQLGAAIPAAAENPAGGLAAAGVGLGMGMAYAQNMTPGVVGSGAGPGGSPGPAPLQPAASPPPPPQAAATAWHVVENGQPVGPFSPAQLAEAIINGRVGPATLLWAAGMPTWTAAQQVPSVAALFRQRPPPMPGAGG